MKLLWNKLCGKGTTSVVPLRPYCETGFSR